MEQTTEHEGVEAAPKVSKWHLHRRLYDWVLHWADTPYGGIALFVLSLAESSCFPVPPDVLLAPLVLGNRKKWFRFALSCSVASVLGGMLGYLIGFGAWGAVDDIFFDHVPGFTRDAVSTTDGKEIECIVETVGDQEHPWQVVLPSDQAESLPAWRVKEVTYGTYSKVKQKYDRYDFWVVFTAGFTPLPYKVITITAGVFRINFVEFLIASAVSRSARFFMVAGLFWIFGPVIKPFIDKYFNLLCLVFMVLLIGGFVVLKYV
ncbi:MAG: DedA family protein [Phycisphaerae bacterium]|nr:DedA family protein [Phycisphaerae bacterium]